MTAAECSTTMHRTMIAAGATIALAPGWSVADVSNLLRDHGAEIGIGIFIVEHNTGEQLNFRLSTIGNAPLTAQGLRSWLYAQGWGVEPVDVVVEQNGGLVLVAGTFRTSRGSVREWYVTDGHQVADGCLADTGQATQATLDACHAMAASVQFPPGAG